MLKLYNTLGRKKEIFKPLHDKKVGLYTCGLTVYWYAHIGNLRTYVFEDILRRVLEYNGYKVKHVMNITDVGHLTSDADEGEDKMVKALKREGKELNEKSMLEMAEFYTKAFKQNLKDLNIQEPHIWCKATEHIKEQINLVKKLLKNGLAYETKEAVYFDTSKLKNYGKLAQLDIKGLKPGARVKIRGQKKNPSDFALWLKLVGKNKNHIMNWASPWGKGFPGWHIECSAMSIKYLGERFDIHCGGIDHIPLHHTNERAQNIGSAGHPVVKFWLHGEFLILKEARMGKSVGNIITLETLKEEKFNPLAFRYLCLTAHYRSKLNFTQTGLEAAQNALDKLYQSAASLKISQGKIDKKYQEKFLMAVNDDLDMPKALGLVWQLVKDNKVKDADKKKTLLDYDRVLGLGLDKAKKTPIPSSVKKLVDKRETLRKEKKWNEADKIRKEIEKKGFKVEDTPKGPEIKIS